MLLRLREWRIGLDLIPSFSDLNSVIGVGGQGCDNIPHADGGYRQLTMALLPI
jgi:hypothetical protein